MPGLDIAAPGIFSNFCFPTKTSCMAMPRRMPRFAAGSMDKMLGPEIARTLIAKYGERTSASEPSGPDADNLSDYVAARERRSSRASSHVWLLWQTSRLSQTSRLHFQYPALSPLPAANPSIFTVTSVLLRMESDVICRPGQWRMSGNDEKRNGKHTGDLR
jgi:hypothetical protein